MMDSVCQSREPQAGLKQKHKKEVGLFRSPAGDSDDQGAACQGVKGVLNNVL